jgi:AAA domain
MIELADMETATPFDRLRLVLVGKEKTGKSKLAATGRKGVLVFDWDNRRESLAGMKGVRAVTLCDPGNPITQPTAFNDGTTILTKLETARTFTGIGFKNVPEKEDEIKTVVVDSVYSMARAAANFAKYTTQDLARTIRIGSMIVRLTNGWDTWNAEIGLVEQFIERLLALKGMDIILIFHEENEEAPSSTPERRNYTGRFEPFPARYGNIIKYFNECWRLTRDKPGAPTIQREPNYQFQASSNLGDIPAVGADISKMIEAYLAKNPSVVQAKPDVGVLALQSGKVEVTPIKGVS